MQDKTIVETVIFRLYFKVIFRQNDVTITCQLTFHWPVNVPDMEIEFTGFHKLRNQPPNKWSLWSCDHGNCTDCFNI